MAERVNGQHILGDGIFGIFELLYPFDLSGGASMSLQLTAGQRHVRSESGMGHRRSSISFTTQKGDSGMKF